MVKLILLVFMFVGLIIVLISLTTIYHNLGRTLADLYDLQAELHPELADTNHRKSAKLRRHADMWFSLLRR